MPAPYARPMGMLVKLVTGGVLLAAAGAGFAVPRDSAVARAPFNQRSDNLPAREIERRVIPTMGDAQYLGFIYDPATNIYTLKFLRNGSVIWVDVDGRSGRIVRRSGR
jgi:hypothetical protein